MERVVELLSSYPTVIFTALLMFCLAWWLVSIVVSGADGADTDVDVDGDGDGDFFGRAGRLIGTGAVPVSLGFTVLSFGGWAVCLLLSIAVNPDRLSGLAALLVGAAVLLIALAAGLVLVRLFSRVSKPVFTTLTAPRRHENVGARVRVRTTLVTHSFGQAEVLTGPLRGAVVKVRAAEGRFTRGDVALVIDFNPDTNVYDIDELPDELAELPPPR